MLHLSGEFRVIESTRHDGRRAPEIRSMVG
jgi:hypothetical protein